MSYPTFKEAPHKGIGLDAHAISIAPQSKHIAEAFKVVETLVSDDVQMDISRQGRVSVLNSKEIENAFGSNMSFMKGKNVQAIFKASPADQAVPTPYDKYAKQAVVQAIKDVVTKGIDINTALRKADETANQKIDADLAQ